MWDEARALAERRWRFARATGRHAPLPSAHEEPTLPAGMFRLPPHMVSRTPTPRIAPLQRRPIELHEDTSDVEPTQKRRAPLRRPAPGLPPRSRPVPKQVTRSAPPPLPANARVHAMRPAAAPAWLQPQPLPQPMPLPLPPPPPAVAPAPLFALPPEPVVVTTPAARTSVGLVAAFVALAGALVGGYLDLRGTLGHGLAATERLGNRLMDVMLSESEARARIEREVAALRASIAERPAAPVPAVVVAPAQKRRRPARLAIASTRPVKLKPSRRTRVVPPTDGDDDPLGGVLRSPRRKRGPALDLEL